MPPSNLRSAVLPSRSCRRRAAPRASRLWGAALGRFRARVARVYFINERAAPGPQGAMASANIGTFRGEPRPAAGLAYRLRLSAR
jgi:hypothetical protein